MTKQEVIQKMVDGQRSHIQWGAKQRNVVSKGKPEVKNVGSAEHHDEWIKVYNWALYYLTRES